MVKNKIFSVMFDHLLIKLFLLPTTFSDYAEHIQSASEKGTKRPQEDSSLRLFQKNGHKNTARRHSPCGMDM
jgi:hypothetical protein